MKPFRSALPSVEWPAFLDPSAAQLASILCQFDRTQWLSPEKLSKEQRPQMVSLLMHALSTVPFYRKRFTDAGLPATGPALAEAWNEIPILTRSEVQQAGKTLYSSALPAAHGPVQLVQTSGSTGTPVTALSTVLTRLIWNVCAVRERP